MGSPEISVIMPLYNADQFVTGAVHSILAQTVRDFEIIIVDDSSTDDSVATVRRIQDPRITVLQHKENLGYPHAMRTGLAIAKGRFIARMDSDDWSAPTRLEKQLEFLNGRPEFGLVGTRRFWITPGGRTYIRKADISDEWVEETWTTVYSGKRKLTDASVMVRREGIDAVGGYRTYQRSGQDVDLWLRLLERGYRAATLTESLFGRRILPGAITFSDGTSAMNQVPRLLADERRRTGADAVMRGELPSDLVTQTMRTTSHAWRVRALWGAAHTCYCAGDRPWGLRFAKEALQSGRASRDSLRGLVRFAAGVMGCGRSAHPETGGALPVAEKRQTLAEVPR